MGIGIVILLGAVILLVLRVMSMIKNLTKYKDDKALATVTNAMTNNRLLYLSYKFEYTGLNTVKGYLSCVVHLRR